ncbi:MAG TPA: hypothetical protein VJA94_09280 [Candidatus Angelobacter sp.]
MTHYERHWAKYRSIKNQLWFSLALGIILFLWPVLTTAATGTVTLYPHSGLDFLKYFAFLWTAASIYRLRFFDCPRCGKSFFVQSEWLDGTMQGKIGGSIYQGRRCVHCRLPIFGSDPEE